MIGDPAMTCPKDGLYVLDLAEEWKKLTGLPAVFAVWAGIDIAPELVDVLTRAKAPGLRGARDCAEESARLGLPYQVCDEYLSRIMVYDLGEREMQGLGAVQAEGNPARAGGNTQGERMTRASSLSNSLAGGKAAPRFGSGHAAARATCPARLGGGPCVRAYAPGRRSEPT